MSSQSNNFFVYIEDYEEHFCAPNLCIKIHNLSLRFNIDKTFAILIVKSLIGIHFSLWFLLGVFSIIVYKKTFVSTTS